MRKIRYFLGGFFYGVSIILLPETFIYRLLDWTYDTLYFHRYSWDKLTVYERAKILRKKDTHMGNIDCKRCCSRYNGIDKVCEVSDKAPTNPKSCDSFSCIVEWGGTDNKHCIHRQMDFCLFKILEGKK